MLLLICVIKHSHYMFIILYRYLFEGCYFGAIMGSAKIAKNKCLLKNTSYTVLKKMTKKSKKKKIEK